MSECYRFIKINVLEIDVRVQPGARREEVFALNGCLKVVVRARAVEGQANEAVIETLASVLKVKKRFFTLVSGDKSRTKRFQITADTDTIHQIVHILDKMDGINQS